VPQVLDVLVVDDDRRIRDALRRALEFEHFTVREANSGEAALEAIAEKVPRVMVLDVSMPGIDGTEVVRRIRLLGHTLPVCMLSARDEVDDRVEGLEAGADDYVVKPFSIADLAARLQALVRLHDRKLETAITVGDLTVDPGRRQAFRNGRDLELTTREFDLLLAFARHSGQVLSRRQLLELVWGYTWDVDTNVVDVFVGYLRKKLEAVDESRRLQTIRGVGFTLRP
jgi:two-component system, OmpR family, response regulator PrrA